MDLAYLRAHPQQLPMFLTHQRIRETPVDGGSICRATRLTLDDGTSLFAKSWPEETDGPPAGFFAAEAAGLRWLASTGTVATPEVLAQTDELLALEWIEPGPADRAAAEDFGRRLAALHRTRAGSFGAAWAGFHGSVPMDNTVDERPWHAWYAERRLLPYLRASRDRGAVTAADAAAVEAVAGGLAGLAADEPATLIHGDLWPGNLLWGADGRCRVVDPAAHGGHRELDLAYLGLWGGAPHLATVEAAYRETYPLAEGAQARRPVHELSMYLLHTALFGEAFVGGLRDTLARCPR